MIKLVIFDLWLTLAYKDVSYSALSRMLEKTKVKIPRDKFIRLYEEALQLKRWKSKFEAYKNLCRNMGLETTRENVNLLQGIRDKVEARAKLYSHTIPMLRQLQAQGYKTGLISNTTIFALQVIEKKTRLLEYVDYPLFSCDVGLLKPDLEFFKEMLKVSKCNPEETVMIGDILDNDVVPPKKLGMNAIHFKDYEQLKKELAKFSIRLS